MRADRLLSIVWLLQSRGRHSANALADRLEVTPRTIHRDIEALSSAGVPVVAIRGRDGGFELLEGYRPAVTALTSDESIALFAGLSAAAAESLGLGASFTSALRKTLAAVPEPSRAAAVNIADRVVIDPEGWLPNTEVKMLEVLQDAVLRDRQLEFTYPSKGNDAPSTRTVDPYGLVNSAGVWYLASSHHGEVKFFRASRIQQPKILDSQAQRPANLELATLWHEHRTTFRSRLTPVEVAVFAHPSAVEHIRSRAIESANAGYTKTINGEQWQQLTLSFGDLDHLIAVILTRNADVLVIEPVEIRQAVLARALAIVDLYADSPTRTD